MSNFQQAISAHWRMQPQPYPCTGPGIPKRCKKWWAAKARGRSRNWGAALHRNASRPRPDIHDPAAIVDQRQQSLGQKVDALKVDIDYGVKIRLGHFVEVDVLRIACVVDPEASTCCLGRLSVL